MKINFHYYLLLSFLLLSGFTVQAQNASLTGIVKDAESKQPIVNVYVTIEGAEGISVTDERGFFEMDKLPIGSQVVIFTFQEKEILRQEVVTSSGRTDLGDVAVSIQKGDVSTDLIPTISLSADDLEDDNSEASDISGLLSASRDVFVSTAAFIFGPARFRIRGYDSENFTTLVNGIPMNDLENGRTYWNNWGGLNDIARNRDANIGLMPTNFTFGGVGGSTSIDMRASTQRKQLRASYAISNRAYRNRVMLTYSTGLLQNGWAFSLSGSRRWAEEGYIPGTTYDAWGYFASAEKVLNDNHSISLTAFGAPNKRGRSTASTQEMYDLAGSNYYNSNWGYQNGEKRNARVANTHQPIGILQHRWNIAGDASLVTSVSYQAGRNGGTALDWYNAPDPRGDYYRYLPSFFDHNEELFQEVTDVLTNSEDARQLQWDKFYDINRNSPQTVLNANGQEGNSVTGNYSRYVVEDRRYDAKKANFNTVYQNVINDNLTLQAGFSYQQQETHNFKVLDDLLGGDFYVDINRFAERDFIGDPVAIQNDVDNPNRILNEGDIFGYDYLINLRKTGGWLQGQFSFKKIDFFLAGDVSQTSFWRTGNVRNGLFPEGNDSFGDSEKQEFFNYGVKGGLTYKLNGRNYLFANGAMLTRAPFSRNSFVSPRTRNTVAPDLINEEIMTGEAGYLLRSPNLKARASVYYTTFKNQINIRSFYNDLERSFANYIMTGIDKEHMGAELALEAKLTSGFRATAVAALGQYIFTSRPQAEIFIDNNGEEVQQEYTRTVYAKNFYVGGTPQSAFTVGLNYSSAKYWFANINVNYFRDRYIDFSPERRRVLSVDLLDQGSEQWNSIIEQEQTDPQFTVDFFGGKSWKIDDYFIYLNVGVSNLLNNTNFITGGYEQLRYNYEEKDVSQFPNRYYYSFGTNFFVSVTFRM